MRSPRLRTSLREMLAGLWRGARCRRLPRHLQWRRVQDGVEPAGMVELEEEEVTVVAMGAVIGLDYAGCSRRLDAKLPWGSRP